MTKVMTGSRAIVTIEQFGMTPFCIYLPKAGTPRDIAAVLAAIAPRVTGVFCNGEVAASFVEACDPDIRVRLIHSGQLPNFAKKSDLLYTVSYSLRLKVAVRIAGSNVDAFSGTLSEFATWASNLTGLEQYVMKTVQFVYNAGSKPGTKRTVRVEKVGHDGASAYIFGSDLEEPEMQKKRFNCDVMQGDIVSLN